MSHIPARHLQMYVNVGLFISLQVLYGAFWETIAFETLLNTDVLRQSENFEHSWLSYLIHIEKVELFNSWWSDSGAEAYNEYQYFISGIVPCWIGAGAASAALPPVVGFIDMDCFYVAVECLGQHFLHKTSRLEYREKW